LHRIPCGRLDDDRAGSNAAAIVSDQENYSRLDPDFDSRPRPLKESESKHMTPKSADRTLNRVMSEIAQGMHGNG
jgi:hypothetical protein